MKAPPRHPTPSSTDGRGERAARRRELRRRPPRARRRLARDRDDVPLDGFLRLNPDGDARHVIVSTDDSFRVLDTGVTIEEHGDHAQLLRRVTGADGDRVRGGAPGPRHDARRHDRALRRRHRARRASSIRRRSRTAEPEVSGTRAPSAPRRRVALEGRRAAHDARHEREPLRRRRARRRPRRARTPEDCPGVHGETVAADEVVVLGCENGAVLYRDGAFDEDLAAPRRHTARIGNQASCPRVGDRPRRLQGRCRGGARAHPATMSLIDTGPRRMRFVELGTS